MKLFPSAYKFAIKKKKKKVLITHDLKSVEKWLAPSPHSEKVVARCNPALSPRLLGWIGWDGMGRDGREAATEND